MDLWKFYHITHRHHHICNPTSEQKLTEICGLLGLEAGARVLDMGCGKGELLIRLAECYGITGVGVDLSPYAVRDARRRHRERIPDSTLKFVCQDGRTFRPDEPTYFDLSMCVGASWIWNGHRGTLLALAAMTKPEGFILVGEPFWMEEPPPQYLATEGMQRGDVGTHHDNVRTGEKEGLTFLYSAVSSPDDWDRYEGLQWYAAAEYARRHPDDPDLTPLMARIRRSRDAYLRWGRDCLGWALYLFRRP